MLEEYAILFVPPILAIIASFFIKRAASRRLFRYGGAFFLVLFSTGLTLDNNCGFDNFRFGTCNVLPESVANLISFLHLFGLGAYLSIAPVLLAIAAFVEAKFRFDQRRVA